ncbi:hypothetical protein HDU76_005899, partial [Blyttiomyces sp. JEL0837]
RQVIKDENGRDSDVVMRFHVSGPTGTHGSVYVHKKKMPDDQWDYLLLEVDVPGPVPGAKRVTLIDNRPRVRGERPKRKGWFGRAMFNPT